MKKKQRDWSRFFTDLESLQSAPGCECSVCSGTEKIKNVSYIWMFGGDEIGKPYAFLQTYCKRCQQRLTKSGVVPLNYKQVLVEAKQVQGEGL